MKSTVKRVRYVKPQVVRIGKVENLTGFGTGNLPDFGGAFVRF